METSILLKMAELGILPLSLGVIVYVVWTWSKSIADLNKTIQNHLAHDQELYERTLDTIDRNSKRMEDCKLKQPNL